jgi:hypothetical protein
MAGVTWRSTLVGKAMLFDEAAVTVTEQAVEAAAQKALPSRRAPVAAILSSLGEYSSTLKDMGAHELRNEMTASRLCSAEQPHKSSRSHRLLAGDGVEVPLQCRNHECNEERSRAIFLEEVHLVAQPVDVVCLSTRIWSPSRLSSYPPEEDHSALALRGMTLRDLRQNSWVRLYETQHLIIRQSTVSDISYTRNREGSAHKRVFSCSGFEELGLIRFEIGVKSGLQRGKLPQYAMLNEDQAIFAATLSGCCPLRGLTPRLLKEIDR